MVKDCLEGIAFVAQRCSEPAEVLYAFPPRPQDPEGQIYNIPLKTFAEMMIPGGFLRNRAFEISFDSGRYICGNSSTLQKEDDLEERVRFTSFPCDVRHLWTTKNFLRNYGSNHLLPPEAENRRVEFFNVVFVTDGNKPLATTDSEGLSSVAAHFAKGIICEQERSGYLWREVNNLVNARAEFERDEEIRESMSLPALLELRSSLAKTVNLLYNGLQKDGGVALLVNDHLLCHVSIWPKVMTQVMAPHQALVLLYPVDEIKLPLDCADIVRRIIEIADPKFSISDLSRKLSIPLPTAQRVAQHLIYWRKATVINALNKHQKLFLAPRSETEQSFRPEFAAKFHHYAKVSLSEVLYCFSQEDELEGIQRRFQNHLGVSVLAREGGKPLFYQILIWLISNGLVQQGMSYYHFLPPPDNGVDPPEELVEAVEAEFSMIRKWHIRRIYQVHPDSHKVVFLCRFLQDFILSGTLDEWSIHSVLSTSHESKQLYHELIKDRKEGTGPTLFHLYECD